MSKTIKATAVGDGAVGKTCALIAFTSNSFPEDYVPTVFDSYETQMEVHGRTYQLTLCDTAGQEDYDTLRPLSYRGTDVFLLCFCVSSWNSFENVSQRWIPELQKHAPDVPIILVGTKSDCRADPTCQAISQAEAQAVAHRLGARKYVECSAKTQEGLNAVFESAVLAAITPKQSSCCVIS